MNELQRLGYLAAMGIDSYVPRFRLPGAKASTLCAVPVVARRRATAEPVDAPVAARAASAPTPDLQALLDDREPALPKPAAQKPAAAREGGAAASLRFAVQIVQTDAGLMVVDGSDHLQSEGTVKRFVANLCQAIAGQPAQVQLSVFRWPLASNARLDQSEEAAREALAASISAGMERSGARRLLLLGEQAARYAGAYGDGHAAAAVIRGPALEQLFAEPGRKAELWQQLRTATPPR